MADVATINTELCLKDLETANKRLDRARKQAQGRRPDREARDRRLRAPRRAPGRGQAGALARDCDEKEAPIVRELSLLTAKPTFYVANVDEGSLSNLGANPHYAAIKKLAESEGAEVVPMCAALEAQIAELDPADRPEFLASAGLEEPGLNA